MNSMRRVGLVALSVVGLTLFASTPAQAGSWWNGTIELLNTGEEPDASGEASLTHAGKVHVKGVKGFFVIEGTLHIDCHGLTPGATYSTPAGTFIANSTGNGSVRATVPAQSYFWGGSVYYFWIADVYRLNSDGSCTLVLTGAL